MTNMMANRDSPGEVLPRRRSGAPLPARGALVAILLGLAGGAWLITARLATPDMRLGVLTSASVMSSSSQMGASDSMSMGLDDFIGIWTVMMVAMMVPSVLPAVSRFDGWMRTTGRSPGTTLLFVAGYLLVWSTIGSVAYLVVQALQTWLPAGSIAALRAGGVLLTVAGVYQLTPPKQACLRHCRSPRAGSAPEMITRAPGRLDPVRAGLIQGAYCLGSSWSLMVVLLLLGMMNLAWMAGIAAVILIEKIAPKGDVIGKVVGWGFVGLGIILVATPHPLPALTGLPI